MPNPETQDAKQEPTPAPDVVSMQNPEPSPDNTTPSPDKGSKKDDDKSKDNSAEDENAKKKKPKGIDTGGKSPQGELINELSQMVAEMNEDVTKAFKSGMKKLGDKFAETELGKSLSGLRQELGAMSDRLASKAWNSVTSSKPVKAMSDAVGALKDKTADLLKKADNAMASGVRSLAEGAKKIGMDSPQSSTSTPSQGTASALNDVPRSDDSSATQGGPATPTSTEEATPPTIGNP